MKQFSRHRSIKELKEVCAKNNWTLDTAKHDVEGSDYVTLYWKRDDKIIPVAINTFNGRFIARAEGKNHTESSNMDGVDWYDALLETVYIVQPVPIASGVPFDGRKS